MPAMNQEKLNDTPERLCRFILNYDAVRCILMLF